MTDRAAGAASAPPATCAQRTARAHDHRTGLVPALGAELLSGREELSV